MAVLAQVLALLTARDVARLVRSCAALSPASPALRDALGLVISREFGDVAGFLRADDASWPRSALTLRCVEVMWAFLHGESDALTPRVKVLRVKELLARARVSPFEEAASCRATSVVVSKAWLVAWKRRAQAFEQLAAQLRPARKKRAPRKRQGEQQLELEGSAQALAAAGRMIQCAHGRLLPLAQCVGRSRRVILARGTFRKLAVYAPELKGFPLETCVDCGECVQQQQLRELEAEERKRSRFETEIKGSAPLVDLLLRKSGYPSNLFAPGEPLTLAAATPRPMSLVQRGPRSNGASYFLVPKKWLINWRKFVRSQGDDAPGPILNSELVCLAHRRSVVPPYISMFLSGFSLEQSLRATQG